MMEISKKTIFISILTILLLSALCQLPAESIWEGSAAMGRYGEFPFTGFYGASNSFQQNDYVEVENLENGKRTRLIVVDRLSDPGLLMLVSSEAAQELGIFQNDIARIKVRKISAGQTVETPVYDDLAYSPDPDLNPAASFGSSEEPAYQDRTVEVEPEPEPEPEAVVVIEPEPEPESFTAAEQAETETSVPTLLKDGLKDAEVLITEEPVPADIAADSPEKPYDWPDTIEAEEPEAQPEPVYLTMDELDDGNPIEETVKAGELAPAGETDVLWPEETAGAGAGEVAVEDGGPTDDGLAGAVPLTDDPEPAGLEVPVSSLELLSAGLNETEPVYRDVEDFSISMLPEVIEKVSEEDGEYLTEASDYYSPATQAAEVALTGLPTPEPDIPVEVVAVLVGDHINMADSFPEPIAVDTNYLDSPKPITAEEPGNYIMTENLDEAVPLEVDDVVMKIAALPALPGGDEAELVEIANGYLSPDAADFTGSVSDYPNPYPDAEDAAVLVDAGDGYVNPEAAGYEGEISDYPNVADASQPVDLPKTEDELVYTEAPEEVAKAELPGPTELPEVAESVDHDDGDEEDVDIAVPEYDENLEVTLVPAEVRPPELVEEELGLTDGEPEEEQPLESDIAEYEPELEEAEVVEAETVEAPAAPDGALEMLEFSMPEELVMATKLEQQKHYLQLGAYKEKNSAIKAAGSLVETYPVTIYADEASAGVSYKLLLGPLSADESGIMLYNFRAGGYSDAFIRRIE
ncbi:MAG: SPOR domain-containing protein [Spirochaetales bacterium]|uniref:SPOR domain-containing protein n=1 Tax=Candidatus Thalassospirochaeta sargassi TaxID=3119039 RepID=A0AAJ1IHT3_9SPIO|nr:SPOR domain-containing protein [Spirochaetales bacterium]